MSKEGGYYRRAEEDDNEKRFFFSPKEILFFMVCIYFVGFIAAKTIFSNDSGKEFVLRSASEISAQYAGIRERKKNKVLEKVFQCIYDGAADGGKGTSCRIDDIQILKELKKLNYTVIKQEHWHNMYWIEWAKN